MDSRPSSYNSQPAIRLKDVSMAYKLYDSPKDRMREALHPFRKKYHRDFYALKDINLEVKRGEILGIVGKNGSGKSTLLKIISRVLHPTTGNVQVNGKISALLELGSGFNPQFTGMENIYFYGSVTGFSRSQMDEKLDEIVDFADIGQFIHQPVKIYSSGMKARLAFAVSTAINPEILILDEVFAVGDIFFRQKCYARLEELKSQDTSIILVTHNLPAVQQYCRKAIILDEGQMLFDGCAEEAVKRYTLLPQSTGVSTNVLQAEANASAQTHEQKSPIHKAFDRHKPVKWPSKQTFQATDKSVTLGEHYIRLVELAICDISGNRATNFFPGDTAFFCYEFHVATDIDVPITGIILANDKNITIHAKHTYQYKLHGFPNTISQGCIIRVWQKIKLDIAPGEYSVAIDFCSVPRDIYGQLHMLSFPEFKEHIYGAQKIQRAASIVILRRSNTMADIQFMGVCNLEGDGDMSIFME